MREMIVTICFCISEKRIGCIVLETELVILCPPVGTGGRYHVLTNLNTSSSGSIVLSAAIPLHHPTQWLPDVIILFAVRSFDICARIF